MTSSQKSLGKEQFLEEGFTVLENVFTSVELSRGREAQEAFYRGEFDCQPEFAWPKPRFCQNRQRRHPYACFFQKRLAELGANEKLLRTLKRLGDGTVRRWFDQLLWNDPIPQVLAAPVDWHIEQSRWQTCLCPLMVTVWIPLQPISLKMGPITMRCPKSGTLSPLLIPDGGAGLFHWKTMHGNPPNRGDLPRRAIAIHYALGSLSYRKRGAFQHLNERFCRQVNSTPDFTDDRVCPLHSKTLYFATS